jgi:hypothetical protein
MVTNQMPLSKTIYCKVTAVQNYIKLSRTKSFKLSCYCNGNQKVATFNKNNYDLISSLHWKMHVNLNGWVYMENIIIFNLSTSKISEKL